MKDLRKGYPDVLYAFDQNFFGLKTNTSSKYQKHYLAAYRVENERELIDLKYRTEEGLKIFENTFGFRSTNLSRAILFGRLKSNLLLQL